MPETEKPIIHVDHRVYHDEPKIILCPFDLEDPLDFPETVEFSIHRIRGLDDVLREIHRPPSEWVNHWLKLDYLEEPLPILFDTGGHPYVMAPAKLKPVTVRVMIKEQYGIFDLLEVATDFCDFCLVPLDDTCHHWINEDEESVADVYICRYCEGESIRWDKEFLERHPKMGELKTR